jgi:hypothetical protein
MTVDPKWKIIIDDDDDGDNDSTAEAKPPQALVREFAHPDFMAGSKFLAAAQLSIHFTLFTLEWQLIPSKKAWKVVTSVLCHTLVLGGLSRHDFHLAMVSIDCHVVCLTVSFFLNLFISCLQ